MSGNPNTQKPGFGKFVVIIIVACIVFELAKELGLI